MSLEVRHFLWSNQGF